MGFWMGKRKLNKWHSRPFWHKSKHEPTAICSTYNVEYHIGWLGWMLEVGWLSIKEAK